MGRKCKRVPLGFDWPTGEIWFGYILPAIPCELCGGTGMPKHGGKVTTWLSKPGTYESEYCPTCEGEGKTWPKKEVPGGPGFQMWEDTSEGSPISPVFETPEELARWLADTKASSFGGMTSTYEQWLGCIKSEHGAAGLLIYASGKMVPHVSEMAD